MSKFGNFRFHLRATAALPFAMAALAAGHVSPAVARETVLYSFQGGTTDGRSPAANLVADSAGNLYGTTVYGGANNAGTVFELARDGTEKVLYSFATGGDGGYPYGSLILDKSGNLYGTTSGGGDNSGTVFKLAPDGTETVLYAFTGFSNDGDGASPYGGLIEGKNGTLYGTTEIGGHNGYGTVFELTKTNGGGYAETVLYSFTGGSDGANPYASLIKDKAGNLYSTTVVGGAYGHGTVFELAPDGTETVLHSFASGSDGAWVYGGLTKDEAGNLYGTTSLGGADNAGIVFKLASDGTETVLHTFAAGGSDGGYPAAGVFLDRKGNLYGTTEAGGSTTNCTGTGGCGTVFKVAPDGTETVLYAFTGASDGSDPLASLIKDTPDGKVDLFGTTFGGGTAGGVVFEIKK